MSVRLALIAAAAATPVPPAPVVYSRRIAFLGDRTGPIDVYTMRARDGRRLARFGAVRLWTRKLDQPRPRMLGPGAEADW